MKKRFISCILALAVSVTLCACSSNQTSSNDSKEKTTMQSSEETTTQSAETEKPSDSNDEKSNNLPIGYIGEDGYYNSYFGFKFVIPKENPNTLNQYSVILDTTLGNDTADTSTIDPSDYATVEKRLTECLDANGSVRAYSYMDDITIGDESVKVEVSVNKLNGKSLDKLIKQDKASIKNDINYVSHSEAKQSTVEFAGESRKCLTYIKDDAGSDGTTRAIIYCVKDDYVCEIGISEYNSLENVLKAFNSF